MHRVIGFIVLALSFGVGWLWIDYRGFEQTPLALPEGGAVYTLPAGGSVATLAEGLRAAGYVDESGARYLQWLAWTSGQAGNLKAGEYHLPPGLTPPALIDLLVSGKVVQHALTIPEGWTFRQLRAALRAHEAVRHTLDGLSDAQVMAAIGKLGEHPEGRFFPDTYHFPRGTTDVDFLARAYRRMATVLDEAWRQRPASLPLATPYEALVLASIVEKETAVPEERQQVAGVFVRRLQKGMRLQTDPTVIYGMGDEFQGDLRRRDLDADTPYNTYTRPGLPPTPIALPGKGSILAALGPAPGDSLYFVARGDGTHQFSATLDEHRKAVDRYQRRKAPATP